ncbi:MAG: biopolymer transporter ExbD [Planctomycetaceae bacterium]|nr:biopolymer transporter ExbD [Planctomycetaceae bacterium]
MPIRRKNNLLVEPPSAATGDIAFNLIVFFLVCASVQPDSGRKQNIPSSETVDSKQEQKDENIEVSLSRTTVSINGDPVKQDQFVPRLKAKLAGKPRPEDRVVVVKSKPETPYQFWIAVTTGIEEAGGVVTLQLEEERTVTVPD